MRLEIVKLDSRAVIPQYMTPGAVGLDLCAIEELVIGPGRQERVRTGLAIGVPEGYEGQIRPRSGLAAKHGVTVLDTPGTIDADYRGEVVVLLVNHSAWPVHLVQGDRIAQLVICPVIRVELVEVTELSQTDRGAGGLGSTGR